MTAVRALLVAGIVAVPACRGERDESPRARPAAMELGPGRFDLADARAGLTALPGYEAVLTVAFDGSNGSGPLRWSTTTTIQVTTSPPARRLTVERSGAGVGADSAESVAERNGTTWFWSAGRPCAAAMLDSAQSTAWWTEPAASLPGVLGAEEAGTETVNGVPATRYTFDQRALGEAGVTRSEGTLWVAAGGGPVVRYRLRTTADSGYFGYGARGTLSWDYRLTRIDRPLEIQLPAACPPGTVEAPRLPDASSIESHPGVLRYRTSSAVAEAAAFYEKELGTLGWTRPDRSAQLSGPLAGMMEELMAAQPEIREALKDPQARKAMEAAGLKGMMEGVQPPPEDPDKRYLLFERGGHTVRVLVTRGEPGTEVLVLGNPEAGGDASDD